MADPDDRYEGQSDLDSADLLVTFSRLPVSACAYHGFGFPAKVPGVSWPARVRAWLKGVLVTELPDPGVCRTHPVPHLADRAGRSTTMRMILGLDAPTVES